MKTNQFDQFLNHVSQLPAEAWEALITQAPSCQWLRPFARSWPFGKFATLYVILGLNDYQLKGRAEVGYWPKVVPLVSPESPPASTDALRKLLLPFYQNERMSDQKVNRLNCFLDSDVCRELWTAPADNVAAEFPEIWHRLARAMNQKPEKKTLAFAMKCLAYALILVDETGFDFGAIPVPVDSRVRTLSGRLGMPAVSDAEERARWEEALRQIRRKNSSVTMVHLDSLLWQIGTLSRSQIVTHLCALGTPEGLSTAIGDTMNAGECLGIALGTSGGHPSQF